MIEFFSSTASTLGVLSPLVDTVVMLFFDYIVIRFKTGVKSSIACSRRSIFGEAAQKKKERREKEIKRTGMKTGKHFLSALSSLL